MSFKGFIERMRTRGTKSNPETAFEKRVIKSKLVDYLESKGFHVSATDSPEIVVFTDKPVNEKSYKYSKQSNLIEPYMTSFGTKGALKLIAQNPLSRQQQWEKELKTKAHEGKKLKGQVTLSGAVSTAKRLSEFGINPIDVSYYPHRAMASHVKNPYPLADSYGDMILKDGLLIQKTLPSSKTVGLKQEYKTYGGGISDPESVVKLVSDMENYDREYAKVLHLDTKNKVTGIETISIGSLNAAITHPREVFKKAVLDNSAAIIFVHNHPSGDPTPSNEDKAIAKKLAEVGELVGIKLLDSIVVGRGRHFSLRESGELAAWAMKPLISNPQDIGDIVIRKRDSKPFKVEDVSKGFMQLSSMKDIERLKVSKANMSKLFIDNHTLNPHDVIGDPPNPIMKMQLQKLWTDVRGASDIGDFRTFMKDAADRTYTDAKAKLLREYGTPIGLQVKGLSDIEAKLRSDMCGSAMEACRQGDTSACKVACNDCGITEACKPTTKKEDFEEEKLIPFPHLTESGMERAGRLPKGKVVPEAKPLPKRIKLKVKVMPSIKSPKSKFIPLYKPKYKKVSVVTKTIGKDGHVRLTNDDMKVGIIRIRY